MTTSPQRRATSIAMTAPELDAFLLTQRTCRIGTVSAGGQPHVTPLWFAWSGRCVWLYSIVRSQRWLDVARDCRVAITVDTGDDYSTLRGVEILGAAEVIGAVPRRDERDERLTEPENLFAEKYFGSEPFVADGRHGWLRVTPGKITSWDFRKLDRLRRRTQSGEEVHSDQ